MSLNVMDELNLTLSLGNPVFSVGILDQTKDFDL